MPSLRLLASAMFAVALFAITLGGAALPASAQSFSDTQRGDIETIVRNYLIATVVAAELLMVSTMGGISPWWDRVANMSETGGAYLWGFLVLTAALIILLRRPGDQPSAPFAMHKAA